MGTAQVLRPLGLTFSFIGAVQGILWTVFSILGILVYTEVIYDLTSITITDPTTTEEIIRYIRSKDGFLTFLIVYILLSVYWMCLSIYQFWLFNKKKETRLKTILIQWAALTGLISIVDLSFTITVSNDFTDEYKGSSTIKTNLNLIIILAVGIRGIVLWIINVGSIIACVFFIRHLKKEEISSSRYNDTVKPIEAFDHLQPRPSSWYAEVVHDDEPMPRISHVNPAFIEDEPFDLDDNYINNNSDYNNYDNQRDDYNCDDNAIERYIDDEFRYIDQSNYPQRYHPDDAWNQNFDSVSRSSLVSRSKKKEPIKIFNMVLHPDEELVPPPVPSPDYTPPSTPVVRARPVLKSNPIYN